MQVFCKVEIALLSQGQGAGEIKPRSVATKASPEEAEKKERVMKLELPEDTRTRRR